MLRVLKLRGNDRLLAICLVRENLSYFFLMEF